MMWITTIMIKLAEVFDSVSRKFAVFKRELSYLDTYLYFNVSLFSIGSKIYIYGDNKVSCYDEEKDAFSKELLKVMKNINSFSCTILPQLEF